MPMSEYVRGLRERVGTGLLLLPSAAAIVRDGRGRLLLVRHAELGVWLLPGGGVEPDEDPAEAAVREAREETGLELEVVRPLGVHGGPEFRVTYPNGDEAAYVPAVFECRVVGGEERPDGIETSEVGWFAPAEAAALPLSGSARALLARLPA